MLAGLRSERAADEVSKLLAWNSEKPLAFCHLLVFSSPHLMYKVLDTLAELAYKNKPLVKHGISQN